MTSQRSSPTRHQPPGGPYVSESLERWYVAVEDAGYLEARRLVKATANLEHDQRLVYVGKRPDCHLFDGEEHSPPEPSEPPCHPDWRCRTVEAWTFDVVDSWRREPEEGRL